MPQASWFCHLLSTWACFTHVASGVSRCSKALQSQCKSNQRQFSSCSLHFRQHNISNQRSNYCQKVFTLHWGWTLKLSIINHNERQHPPHIKVQTCNIKQYTLSYRSKKEQQLFSSCCTHTTLVATAFTNLVWSHFIPPFLYKPILEDEGLYEVKQIS